IRSRSQILRFQKLNAQELSQDENMNDTAVTWAGGRFDYAQRLLEDETIEYLNHSLQLFYSLLCSSPEDWKKKAPWFFTHDEWQDFCFHIWNQALEKRLSGQSENLEWIPENPGRLSQIFECVEDFRSDLNRHVDKLLAMENFYYKLKENSEVQQWN
ncbi:MAG: hypothetical protein HRT44_11255, partial [Bdellovibrionales bacterium]|nr:hypothetical protein [Bdellovibrionales bacterium]NQZ19818.1 hypothetical protein [Bdellovibrionales bacterium]